MDNHIRPVELEKAYRLLNHGPTVLVSSSHEGTHNVMAAAWACALDFSPPKVTLVIDKITKTRGLVEKSGYFALQVPNLDQLQMTFDVGTQSKVFTPTSWTRPMWTCFVLRITTPRWWPDAPRG